MALGRNWLFVILVALLGLSALVLAQVQTQKPVLTADDSRTESSSIDGVDNYYVFNAKLATGGLVSELALNALITQGFEQVIDLRSAAESPEVEGEAAKALGLTWLNFPMSGELASAEQIQQFGAALGDKKTLVHCRSGNRVGMAWALWQISQGVDVEQAIAQGRAMGMKDGFEQAIRASTAP